MSPAWLLLFCIPWFSADLGPTLAFIQLGVFLWKRITESDADKAQRLITRSQRLLEKARILTSHAQRTAAAVDDEFERRLRIVSGDKGRTD